MSQSKSPRSIQPEAETRLPPCQQKDAQIAESYVGLRARIEYFVAAMAAVHLSHLYLRPRQQFLVENNVKVPESHTRLVSLVASVVMRKVLRENVFDEVHPIGMTEAQQKTIEQGLADRKCDTPEEIKALFQWRTETISDMMKQDAFAENQLQKLERMYESARTIFIRCGLPVYQQEDRQEMLRLILEHAVVLHEQCQSSGYHYRMLYARLDDEVLFSEHYLREYKSWSHIQEPAKDIDGRFICCIHPALIRIADTTKERVVLVKATLVVESYDTRVSDDATAGPSRPRKAVKLNPSTDD